MKSRRLKSKKKFGGKPNLGENFQNFQRSLADENKEFRWVRFFIYEFYRRWMVSSLLQRLPSSSLKKRLVFLRLKFCAFLSFEYWVLESCEFFVWGLLSVIEC